MRLAVAVLAALCAGAVLDTAKADPYPWCAVYGVTRGGSTNCYFMTLAQCQATVSGIGGFCEHNNFYDGRPVTTPGEAIARPRKREPR